jgi:hypothetical protein
VKGRSAIVAMWIVGCGARTGLDVLDASPPGVDASHDAPIDAPIDIAPDVPVPPPPPTLCPFKSQTDLAVVKDNDADCMALDATYVYFHTTHGIWRVPKAGGAATQIATTGPVDWPLWSVFTVNATTVTWMTLDANASDSILASGPIGGGPATTITGIPGRFMAIFDGSQRYVWEPDFVAGLLDVVNGSTATTVGALPVSTEKVIERGTSLYGASASEGVFRRDGTTITFLSSLPAFSLAMDDTNVYFTGAASATVNSPMAAYRVDAQGTSSAVAISQAKVDLLGGIALQGDYVYFTRREEGELVRVDKNGTTSATIGAFDGQIIDVATDDACVYFTGSEGSDFDQSHVFVAPL